MTKNILAKIAIGSVAIGALIMYLSSIPFFAGQSHAMEIIGSAFFYAGAGTLMVLFLSILAK